jgi:hypothetical protein
MRGVEPLPFEATTDTGCNARDGELCRSVGIDVTAADDDVRAVVVFLGHSAGGQEGIRSMPGLPPQL